MGARMLQSLGYLFCRLWPTLTWSDMPCLATESNLRVVVQYRRRKRVRYDLVVFQQRHAHPPRLRKQIRTKESWRSELQIPMAVSRMSDIYQNKRFLPHHQASDLVGCVVHTWRKLCPWKAAKRWRGVPNLLKKVEWQCRRKRKNLVVSHQYGSLQCKDSDEFCCFSLGPIKYSCGTFFCSKNLSSSIHLSNKGGSGS